MFGNAHFAQRTLCIHLASDELTSSDDRWYSDGGRTSPKGPVLTSVASTLIGLVWVQSISGPGVLCFLLRRIATPKRLCPRGSVTQFTSISAMV